MQKNKINSQAMSSAVLRIFAVLLMATLISSHVIASTVARYVTSGTSNDTARVASFSVSAVDNTDEDLSLRYGTAQESSSYRITVTNNSEVDVSYTVIIQFYQDVAGKLTAAIKGIPGEYDRAAHTFTWRNAGSLEIGVSEDIILTFTAGDGILPTESDTTTSASESYGFSAEVIFEQID